MSAMWAQFRRLLLGTVVEHLLDEDVAIDFSTITIDFHEESDFRVPRLDNYMRFKGQLTARLQADPAPGTQKRLTEGLRRTWPELLKVVDIPIGDRLTSERNEIRVRLHEGELRVSFDLVAD